jgi:hypothetical protein
MLRVTTEPNFRIKIYFFTCFLPESLFCQRLYLNIVDDVYMEHGSTEDVNRIRICGVCPQAVVTLSNKIKILLQSDAAEEMGTDRRFALRLEKTTERPTMHNVRDATPKDPSLVSYSFSSQNSSDQAQVQSADMAPNLLNEAADTVTKLRSSNFWLALILSIVGFLLALVVSIALIRCYFCRPKSADDQTRDDIRQIKWLKTVPKSFKDIYFK